MNACADQAFELRQKAEQPREQLDEVAYAHHVDERAQAYLVLVQREHRCQDRQVHQQLERAEVHAHTRAEPQVHGGERVDAHVSHAAHRGAQRDAHDAEA